MQRMCLTLDVHPSGYYAWRHCPQSARAKEDKKLTGQIKQSWLESGAVYGYRKVHRDLRDMGQTCGVNRVHRLMRAEGLKSQSGYRKPRHRGGKPSTVAPNHLGQRFDVLAPNDTWVTDITYIRTHEGWLYLAVVLDSALSADHRLVDADSDRPRVGCLGIINGHLAASAQRDRYSSLRPRRAIYEL